MAKRRSVILGVGALTFGSGAVAASGAFTGEVTTPTAQFQILSDALTIRRRADTDSQVTFVTDSASFTDFASYTRSQLPALEITADDNDTLALQLAAETNENYTFTEPLEIANDTANTYNVAFHYASSGNISKTHADWGYGADVNDAPIASTTPSTDGVSYERVNGTFVFADNAAGDTTGGTQLSPSGTAVESSTTISLSPGQTAAIDLTVNTSSAGDVGAINSAATGSGSPPAWNSGANYVDLMDFVNVEAVQA